MIESTRETTLVRRAEPADAAAISSVLKEAFAEYEPLYTAEAYAATTVTAAGVLERLQEGPLWIAIVDGNPIGTASAVSSSRGCYIRGMAVTPFARGRRIGWKLLEEIERWARGQDSPRMYLCTTPFLDRAITLYERYGFVRTEEGPTDLFGTPLFTMVKAM